MSDFTMFGTSVFDLMDFISSNILLPAGGLCMAIFLGYVLSRPVVETEITSGGRYRPHLAVFYFLVRYVVPIAVFLIFLNGIC
jgi:NSS family neurotransmitter:Na+ symporter